MDGKLGILVKGEIKVQKERVRYYSVHDLIQTQVIF